MNKMRLKALSLAQFRCFQDYHAVFEGKHVVFLGENGTGKTALLEAMSLFSSNKGIRGAPLDELKRRKDYKLKVSEPWWVRGHFETDEEGAFDFSTASHIEFEKEKRFFKRDGELIKVGTLTDSIQFVWCAPQLERQFCENAHFRRKFLDRLIHYYDPMHKKRLNRYETLMRERGVLFKTPQLYDPHWLTAMEAELAQMAVAIIAVRHDFLERIGLYCGNSIFSFPPVTLEVQGEFEKMALEAPALLVEERIKAVLLKERTHIKNQGGFERGSLFPVGPHRSLFILKDKASHKDFLIASTGQRKLMLLHLILSHVAMLKEECHYVPILLLDDIAAYLDERRQIELFESIDLLDCQCF